MDHWKKILDAFHTGEAGIMCTEYNKWFAIKTKKQRQQNHYRYKLATLVQNYGEDSIEILTTFLQLVGENKELFVLEKELAAFRKI